MKDGRHEQRGRDDDLDRQRPALGLGEVKEEAAGLDPTHFVASHVDDGDYTRFQALKVGMLGWLLLRSHARTQQTDKGDSLGGPQRIISSFAASR